MYSDGKLCFDVDGVIENGFVLLISYGGVHLKHLNFLFCILFCMTDGAGFLEHV